jgi:hypothetical protein
MAQLAERAVRALERIAVAVEAKLKEEARR